LTVTTLERCNEKGSPVTTLRRLCENEIIMGCYSLTGGNLRRAVIPLQAGIFDGLLFPRRRVSSTGCHSLAGGNLRRAVIPAQAGIFDGLSFPRRRESSTGYLSLAGGNLRRAVIPSQAGILPKFQGISIRIHRFCVFSHTSA